MHAHGAWALKLGGGGNGEPPLVACRAFFRLRTRSSCPRGLLEGAQGGASASTRGERAGLITQPSRLSICDEDAWSGMHEPWAHMVSSPGGAPDAQAQICSSTPTACKMIEQSTACYDCTAVDDVISPAWRQQHRPAGYACSEHGLAVHVSCERSMVEEADGAVTSWGA